MEFTNLFVILASVCLIVANAGPVPQENDYGDFSESDIVSSSNNDKNNEEDNVIGNLFGQIVEGVGNLFEEGVGLFANLASGESDLGETLGDAVDVGIEAAQEAGNIGLEAVQAAPKILEEKVEFAKGLGKTVEETSGVVKEGFEDVALQAKVGAAVAKTYGEMALEGILGFFNDFGKRLKCNTTCQKYQEGTSERDQCELENCVEIEKSAPLTEAEEEYDYSYGYDEEELAQIAKEQKENEVEVSPRDN